jgi:DNA replication licensing factor MCM2
MPAKRARGADEPPAPRRRRDESESDEEEPEGDDLFDDKYMEDYRDSDESDDDGVESEGLNSFIGSDESDMSAAAVQEVNERLDRRDHAARAIAAQQRADADAIEEEDAEMEMMAALYSDDEDAAADAVPGGAGGGGGDGGDSDDGDGGGGGGDDDDAGDDRDAAERRAVFRDGEMPNVDFDWKRPHGSVADWLAQDAPRRVVKNRIFNFLMSFTVNEKRFYVERVQMMKGDNRQSFTVSYVHLGEVYESILAIWLADVPEIMLELIDEAANHMVYHKICPGYGTVHKAVRVRIADLPLCDPIRDFRQVHRDVLVRVEGVVIRRSPVYPQLQAVRYDCAKCSFIIGPVMQRTDREVKVNQCPSCQSKGPFSVNMAMTEYRNHQTIVLQESPGKVPPGRLPRSVEVVLTNDIIDIAKPGEEVEVIGVYKNSFDAVLNSKQGFPVFTTILVANNVTSRSATGESYRLPQDERDKIVKLANHERIKKKLVQSIAPSIHGGDDTKLGLLLSLLGGVPKDVGDDQSHRIRGDIHVLLVGDPGTAKSQLLKFVEKISDRAVFTTGRGSTAVGLTASVHKDPVSGDFTLEGGALVIADKGVCMIDEFDKMSDQDRTSIHEAMEQQTISVAKGGIVTTLSARCTIMAAANPVGGRYDPSVSFDANIDLTTPILSRFDLLFVIRDEVNPDADTRLAQFICRSHARSHPLAHEEAEQLSRMLQHTLRTLEASYSRAAELGDEEECARLRAQMVEVRERGMAGDAIREDEDPTSDRPFPQAFLRKYIRFAKTHCRPLFSGITEEHTIPKLYAELRQESKHGGIPITVRHMECIVRLSEAHARLHLREYVRSEDVNCAIALFLRCFLATQKYSMRKALEKKFRKYLESDVEPVDLLLHRLQALVSRTRVVERRISGVHPTRVEVECSEFDASVADLNIARDTMREFYDSALFQREFELERDQDQAPFLIRHTEL